MSMGFLRRDLYKPESAGVCKSLQSCSVNYCPTSIFAETLFNVANVHMTYVQLPEIAAIQCSNVRSRFVGGKRGNFVKCGETRWNFSKYKFVWEIISTDEYVGSVD